MYEFDEPASGGSSTRWWRWTAWPTGGFHPNLLLHMLVRYGVRGNARGPESRLWLLLARGADAEHAR